MEPGVTVDIPSLGSGEFEQLREFVRQETGVALGDAKKVMVQTRLGRRLKALGLRSFTAYLALLRSPSGAKELPQFIGAITTHTTHFWREAHHFEELEQRVIGPAQKAGTRRLRIWCAASSTGEEPWCLAMTVAKKLGTELSGWDVRILATDIDQHSLARAEAATYDAEVIEQRPEMRRYFLRGVRSQAGLVCVRPELRRLLTFRRMNLIEADWRPKARFDAIFLRNVLIYFTPDTQVAVVASLSGYLGDTGVLVLGHAESMVGVRAGLKAAGRGVFLRRTDA